MLKDKTKLSSIGNSEFILIPKTIIHDSTFPLKKEKELNIEIIGETIVIK